MAATIARKRIVSRDDLIQAIRDAEPALRSRGITSVVLTDAGEPTSLVELLVDYDPTYPVTLVTLVEIEHHLGDRLGRSVELTTLDALDGRDQAGIAASGSRVF